MSNYLEDIAKKIILKNNLSWDDLINSVPHKETLVTKQFIEALLIKKLIGDKYGDKLNEKQIFEIYAKNKDVNKKINVHVKKYSFLGVGNFVGEPMDVKKFFSGLMVLKEPEKRRKENFKIPNSCMYLSRIIETFKYWRQYFSEVFAMLTTESLPFLYETANKLGIKYQELMFISPEDALTALKYSKLKKIKIRNSDFIYFLHDNKEIIYNDKDKVEDFIGLVSHKSTHSAKSVLGVTAQKGKSKGYVKIILNPNHFSKMEAGDILVTSMTTPEYVPLMQKASAVVNDIGGLLSHAAIISRELGIPCVIGTRIATKVLKDGDLVEVDADKGIVRMISSL
jgi:phosphoenolpyruvate synthase/pyruvate phosphate dikinase